MPRLTVKQRFDRMPDLATPYERRWLDRFGKATWRHPSRLKIAHRTGPADGEFRWVTVLGGTCIGSMPCPLDYMKQAVRKGEAHQRRERARQAVLETGAYI